MIIYLKKCKCFCFANALIQSLWWYLFWMAFWCERQCWRSWPFMYVHSTSVSGHCGRTSVPFWLWGWRFWPSVLHGVIKELVFLCHRLLTDYTFHSPSSLALVRNDSANSCMREMFLIALASITISLCHKQVNWNTFIITMRHRRATIYLQTAMEKTERKQMMLVNYPRPHIQLLPVKIYSTWETETLFFSVFQTLL